MLGTIIKNKKDVLCIRYIGKIPNEDDLLQVVKEEYNKNGLEDELEQLNYSFQNGYIVLFIEK